ncbi:MAG: ribosomal protein S18-alanine N-acetyltransferase [bacterium]|nr:ribosomal protein S18-alanine N-acetyltransferase [bacterium]MCP4965571.1 ribosomal protein S18-alanine N-acetyltransferase [bacterium]
MPTTVEFRTMTLADIPIAVELERATYPQPWSEGVFIDELGRDDRAYILAEVDGVMVGFGGLMFVEKDAHVTTIAVMSNARKRGLGTRLMLELIDAGLERGAQNLTLEVRATNDAAQRLYNRFGMVAVGVRKHYYRDDDAVIMWVTDIDQPEYSARLDEIRISLGEQS